MTGRCGILVVLLLSWEQCAVASEETAWSSEQLEFFENQIRPVLVERCDRCHSQAAAEKGQLKGGLLVDSREGLRNGGDSGAAIVPGKPGESLLLESLRYESFEMPPDGKLSEDVIVDFEQWIASGAADPRTGDATRAERVIDIEQGREHWAYRPIPVFASRGASEGGSSAYDGLPSPSSSPDRSVGTPDLDVRRTGPVTVESTRSVIDVYVASKLAEEGLTPVGAADRTTLARRLSFDLVGLPPTPEQVDLLLADDAPGAYERYVDELLASPQFGVRWGRHWLDVARFAESVTLRGLVQHHAWRYRDYVVDSFNADRPFDQFLREQIAGDLLDAESLEDRQRQHIATGFLTLADANLEDQDKEKLRMDVVDEQLSVIGKAILGQTLGCARCHDHKFDPIPATDYYALAGILRNTRTMEHSNVSRWIDRPLPVSPEREREFAEFEKRLAELETQIAKLKGPETTSEGRIVGAPALPGIVVDDEAATLVGSWQRSTSVKAYVDAGYQHDGGMKDGMKSATFETAIPKDGLYEVRLSYSPSSNRSSKVPVFIETADGIVQTRINQRKRPPIDGLFFSLGKHRFTADKPAVVELTNTGVDGHVIIDAVQFLSVEENEVAEGAAADTEEPEETARTKLERAQRLSNLVKEQSELQRELKQRPMYQGVEEEAEIGDMQVNIRGNVHNLGETVPRGFLQVACVGAMPVVSADQSGRVELAEWVADPANPLPARVYVNRVWHWLFGRGIVATPDNFGAMGERPTHPELLDYLAGRFIAEGWSTKRLVREIVLSGTYRRSSEPTAEGMAVDPDNRWLWRMNRKRLEAECLQDAMLSCSVRLDLSMGGKSVPSGMSADYDFEQGSERRAIYWPQFRNSRPEMQVLFDGANPSLVSGRRNVSSVAPQALYLMNSPWVFDQAQATAERLLAEKGLSESLRVQQAFRVILGRLPTDEEERLVTAFVSTDEGGSTEEQLDRWTHVVQSLFGSLDFRYLH